MIKVSEFKMQADAHTREAEKARRKEADEWQLRQGVVSKLRERITSGEPVDDPLAALSLLNPIYSTERIAELRQQLVGKKGQMVLFVETQSHLVKHVMFPTETDQNEYGSHFLYYLRELVEEDLEVDLNPAVSIYPGILIVGSGEGAEAYLSLTTAGVYFDSDRGKEVEVKTVKHPLSLLWSPFILGNPSPIHHLEETPPTQLQLVVGDEEVRQWFVDQDMQKFRSGYYQSLYQKLVEALEFEKVAAKPAV